MDNFDFHAIRYRMPRHSAGKRTLPKLIGIDSEAYTDGIPFMFSTSLGFWINPNDWPHILGTRDFRGANFATWNLRYDSGAFLHHLDTDCLEFLRRVGRVETGGWSYKYFPHKFLRIKNGRTVATFWDVMPFYKSSLDKAGEKFLGMRKLEVPTKRFTRTNVKKHWKQIVDYGLRDADMTARLGNAAVKTYQDFGMTVSALYSPASVSQRFFAQRGAVVDVWKFWKNRRMVLQRACEAYAGGLFEITKRGRFNGYQYDSRSAYPFEMANLEDISEAKITRSKIQPDSARYGFARIRVNIRKPLLHTLPVKVSNVNIYPIGRFETTVTLAELEDLKANGVDVTILDAHWLTIPTVRYPYRETIKHLMAIKEGPGKKDPHVRRTAKDLSTAIYGKLCQLTPDIDMDWKVFDAAGEREKKVMMKDATKYLRAGPAWNPVYAAIITANTRLKCRQIQRDVGDECFAIHTDSVITTRKIPKKYLGPKLGDWVLEREGEGIVLGCGVYEIADKVAFRGLRVPEGFTWSKALKKAGTAKHLRVAGVYVPSWMAALARGKRETSNVFTTVNKRVDLNSDAKRIWDRPATARGLLKGLQGSSPQGIIR